MANTFHVEIVTPERTVYSGEVEAVTVPGVVGPFQVLIHHAPIISELDIGEIRIVESAKHEHLMATSGGFVEVKNDRMTVLAETAEPKDAIDVARAQSALERARGRVREAHHIDSHVDRTRAEAALARATNRLRIAGTIGR